MIQKQSNLGFGQLNLHSVDKEKAIIVKKSLGDLAQKVDIDVRPHSARHATQSTMDGLAIAISPLKSGFKDKFWHMTHTTYELKIQVFNRKLEQKLKGHVESIYAAFVAKSDAIKKIDPKINPIVAEFHAASMLNEANKETVDLKSKT